MDKKTKIKGLLKRLETLNSDVLTDGDREKITVKFLDDIGERLVQFKKDFDLKPLTSVVNDISKEIEFMRKSVASEIEKRSSDTEKTFRGLMDDVSTVKSQVSTVENEKLAQLKSDILGVKNKTLIQEQSSKKMETVFSEIINDIETKLKSFTNDLKWANEFSAKLAQKTETKVIDDIEKKIESLRTDLSERLANIHRGGNANRQTFVDGVDPLTRYTDINLIAGTGVTITTANDDTTRKVNITFTSSGLSPQTPTSGVVDGSNTIFEFSSAPSLVSVDQGRFMQRTSSDGTVNWTGTTTITLLIAPTFDIFAL